MSVESPNKTAHLWVFYCRNKKKDKQKRLPWQEAVFNVVDKLGRLSPTGRRFGPKAKGIVPVENLLESMIWTIIGRHPMMDTINQTSMGLLLMNLSHFADQIGRGDPEQGDQTLLFTVLDYIEHHYQNGTLAEISELTHTPPYAVSRVLKKRTGKNFKELLQLRKLQQAVYLLENSTLPIDRIIEHIGYENSSYFYRRFREKYGCSPSAYREN